MASDSSGVLDPFTPVDPYLVLKILGHSYLEQNNTGAQLFSAKNTRAQLFSAKNTGAQLFRTKQYWGTAI